MATVALLIDFQIGSLGSETTLVDRSSSVTNMDLSMTQDLPDSTAFNGGAARSYSKGLSEGEFSVDFLYSTAIYNQLTALMDSTATTAISFQYGPDGNATGKPKRTGSCFIQSISDSAAVGDLRTISATFLLTGAVTRASYA